jgi:hypothetical protein
MVAPGGVLDVLLDVLLGGDVSTGEDLLDGDELALEGLAGESNGVGHGLEVSVKVANTGVKVVVDDVGHLERVRRAQSDATGVVTGMSLEDSPREHIVTGSGVEAVLGEVTTEVNGSTEGEDVELVVLGSGALVEHGSTETGGRVDTTVAEDRVVPSVEAGVRRGGTECASAERSEVFLNLTLNADLVVILKVGADTGEVDDDGNVKLLELLSGTNTAQLEQLRRVVCSTSNDDLTGSSSRSGSTLGALVLGAGLVEVLSVEELDTGSAGRGGLVEGDLGDMAVHADIKRVLLGAVGVLRITDLKDELAGAVTLAVVGGERNLVQAGGGVTLLSTGVGVSSKEGLEVEDKVGLVGESDSSATDQAQQLNILGDDVKGSVLGRQPTVLAVAVANEVESEVVVVLELGEVLAHVVS